MLGFKASAVLLAVATGAVSSVLADSPNWSLRELNPDNYLDFPGRVMLLETTPLVEGSLDDCVDFCESFDNCIAFVYDENYQVNQGYCAALAYSSLGFANMGFGYEWVGFRYNAPEGPVCDSDSNYFDDTGLCVCDPNTQESDTAFGCRARATASQAARRRRMARDIIMPGQAQKAAY